MANFCPKCGRSVRTSDSFCDNCGSRFENETEIVFAKCQRCKGTGIVKEYRGNAVTSPFTEGLWALKIIPVMFVVARG